MNPETAKALQQIGYNICVAAVLIVFILAIAGVFNCPCK